MNFPKEAISQILYFGLLRIREKAAAGATDDCYNEADHLHNLPGVLEGESVDQLRYYYEIELPLYLKKRGSSVPSQVSEALIQISRFLQENRPDQDNRSRECRP